VTTLWLAMFAIAMQIGAVLFDTLWDIFQRHGTPYKFDTLSARNRSICRE
jgi:hypothetical protein